MEPYHRREVTICRVPGHYLAPDDRDITMAECEEWARRIERDGGVGQLYLSVRTDHIAALAKAGERRSLMTRLFGRRRT